MAAKIDVEQQKIEERAKAQYMRECLRHNLVEQCEALWKYREEQR